MEGPRPRRFIVAAALAGWIGATNAAEPVPSAPREWNFQVLLDGEPIGTHRFRLEREGETSRLTSDARFDVKVLGFTAYRYRHHAVEHWRGDCLVSLVASTDADGTPSQVRLAAAGEQGALRTASAGSPGLDGCVMSFAYWNPAMLTQTRLLNAQTGKVEPVHIEQLPGELIDVRGEPVAGRGYRIAGATRPVDVWYADDGRWIGLDAVVGKGRKLGYRLR